MSLQQATVTETGDKVIPGTRRPDGTLRKERRVRAGYVPQEEQQVYKSVGAQWAASVPKCPGLNEAAAKVDTRTKAQKKNEKRKEKKVAEPEAAVAQLLSNAATQQMAALSTSSRPPASAAAQASAASPSQAAAAAAPAADPSDPRVIIDKQIKNTSKKVRQCEALLEKGKSGEKLTQPEEEKLAKMKGWQQEIADLQAQLDKL